MASLSTGGTAAVSATDERRDDLQSKASHQRPSAASLKRVSRVDPTETCLPEIAPTSLSASSTSPNFRGSVPVRTLKSSFATTLVGARDIRGRGSHFPEVTHADPFILVHYIEHTERIKPPFCAHPHMGTEVATVSLRGEEIWPWDNINGYEKTKLHAGGVYLCSTGRGLVHDESQQPPFTDRRVKQASFVPGEGGNQPSNPGDFRSQFLQVWWNAGYIYSLDQPLPSCSTQLISPAEIPICLIPGGLAVRVLIGDLPLQSSGEIHGQGEDETIGPCSSPVRQRGTSHVLMMHARASPGANAVLTVPADMNGFLFICDMDGGEITILEQDTNGSTAEQTYCGGMPSRQMAKLPPGGSKLHLKNQSDTKPCEMLIFLGQPNRKPYSKYVGYGGAMVHANEELVQEAMSVYEQDPKNFGRDDSKAQIDWSKYYLVPGFQNPGGGGLERPDGILARFAEVADVQNGSAKEE